MSMSESTHPTVHDYTVEYSAKQETVVIKVGGSVLENLSDTFFKEIIYLLNQGWFPVIVHGGGPSITKMLNRLGIVSSFHQGLRITDEKTLEIVQMVLNGKENKEMVKRIQQAGGNAIGLSGIDNNMIVAEPLDSNLGYVGSIKKVSFPMVSYLRENKIIPVISPLGTDEKGQIYNINADTVAQALASHLKAKKVFLVSDVPGIYTEKGGKKETLKVISYKDINQLKKSNQISGGMIPKMEAATQCLLQGTEEIYVLDGREEGALSKIYHHQAVGTKILKSGVV